jgi:S-DNA-T family DNA segregation ATPase FtsK/SpoIIIE
MKVKVSYRRSSGAASDVVITTEATATLHDIAHELLAADAQRPEVPQRPLTLAVAPPGGRSVRLPGDRAVGEAALASGYEVEVVPGDDTSADQRSSHAAIVHVIAGPDAGKRFPIATGSTIVGRDATADLVLRDPYVSKRHARIDVGRTIEVVDLNSANGIQVDGGVSSRVTMLPGQEIEIGDTRMTVTATGVTSPYEDAELTAGAISFHRSPRVEVRFTEHEHPRPSVPSEPMPPMFPWLMLLAPVVMGTAMYGITRNPLSLLFVAMAPMMMTTNFVTTRSKNRRQVQGEVDRFDAQLSRLEEALAASLPREIATRQEEAPSVSQVYRSALERGPLLWTRRPEHWSFLHVRLGVAALASRTTVAPPGDSDDGIPEHAERLDELVRRFGTCADVPVLESGPLAGSLGVVGTHATYDALRGIVVQLAGLHAPSELVVTALTSPGEVAELSWLRWLPHTSSAQSPVDGIHLADTQATVASVVTALEQVAEERLGRRTADAAPLAGPLASELVATGRGGRLGSGEPDVPPPTPVILLVITEHAPIDRARVVQLCERAPEIGLLPIWVSSQPQRLPAVCRTFVDVSGGLEAASVHFVRHGEIVDGVRVEGVSIENADRFALALAPLVDSGAAVSDATDLPHNVSLVGLLGTSLSDTGEDVLDRWRENQSIHDRDAEPRPRARTGTLRALVGQRGVDAMHLDLRADGPHALVGGTTGAGKSEFLQAWVLAMAAEYSPDRVAFLFVDYKGGAAFGDCVKLPHCVGLVTDLTPFLVRRALTSLRAELHHREHLLNRKQAKDLLELEKRGDPEAPPALVVVIDEFAALVGEVPEFVDGVVDIAQRGRSLGIHLIVATQRPAGVIRDNLRANTNLRIALRMADEADSSDVIGTPVAASFDPAIPGRGVAKSGPGRLTTFQSAYAGGHTSSEPPPAVVEVHTLRFGADELWTRPEEDAERVPEDPGPTDQSRLVASIVAAADGARIPPPRKPWLEELSKAYDLTLLGPRTDAELILGVTDLPEKQRQEIAVFRPDLDGNLAVYGTGGSGKSVLLRTLAAGAGVTPRGGPVHVYGLDFAAGGLRILAPLPHVGDVVPGDDEERVVRLFRTLRDIADERARTYPLTNAGSITEYRDIAGLPDEPRILLLIDGFPSFREAYEVPGPRGQCYATLQQLLSEGRQLGVHVVFTADRPASVPGSIAASVPRRVVLRLADEASYLMLGFPGDVLDATSAPGRSLVDGLETQVAILGGSGNVADQSQAIGRLAAAIERRGAVSAPAIESLPTEVGLDSLPAHVDRRPVLGISDETLAPMGFDPIGVMVVAGGPGSGRTNALLTLAQSVKRWRGETILVYLGSRRSTLPDVVDWDITATAPEEIASTAKELKEAFAAGDRARHTAIFVENVPDLVGTPAEQPVVELLRAVRRSDHLAVAEADSATLGSMAAIYTELRSSRRGLLLQPDHREGETLLRTPFPRSQRSEFPVGRGMWAARGRAVRVQVPLASRGVVPIVEAPAPV